MNVTVLVWPVHKLVTAGANVASGIAVTVIGCDIVEDVQLERVDGGREPGHDFLVVRRRQPGRVNDQAGDVVEVGVRDDNGVPMGPRVCPVEAFDVRKGADA